MTWRPSPNRQDPGRYKDDVDLQVQLEQELREGSYTQAELGNHKAKINTIGKYKGKKVWCEELETYLFAAGTRAYDIWSDGKGFYAIYPGSAKFEGTITAPGVQSFSAEYRQATRLGGNEDKTVSTSASRKGIRNEPQKLKGGIEVEEILWEDLRFPAQAINPPGGVNDADIDTDDGALLFDDNNVEQVLGIAQLPHAWKEGTEIRPHVHYECIDTSTGDVVLNFVYSMAKGNGEFSSIATAISTVSMDGVVNTHRIAGLADIDMVGYNISTIIKWKIIRQATDAGDTYGSDFKLLEFDIHYQVDKRFPGSPQEYIKGVESFGGLLMLSQTLSGVIE
jgi:hypothetical protein